MKSCTCTWFANIFTDYTLNTGIFSYTDVTCKSSRYLYYWAESCTQWLLVLFTLNRVVAIAWPLTAKIILSERSTLSAICRTQIKFELDDFYYTVKVILK